VKPSGPGAFVDPMLESASKISCSDGMEQRVLFSAREIEFSNRERNSSGQGGVDLVKREEKWEEKQFPIVLRSVIHAPVEVFRKSMEDRHLLMRVEV
jgi:hypothetical protein